MPDTFFLPDNYRTNHQSSSEADGKTQFWSKAGLKERYQLPTYRWAARIVRERGLETVVDLGCGTGVKTFENLAGVARHLIGIDQPSGITIAKELYPDATWIVDDFDDPDVWGRIVELKPDLVLSADVIEHLDDPKKFAQGLASVARSGSLILVSTPDRDVLEGANALGPPTNPRHIREWTEAELAQLLNSCGLTVIATHHHLPRTYGWTPREVLRSAHRIVTGRHPRDRKSAMAFLCSADG